MTLSDTIRKAALGPTPNDGSGGLLAWVDFGDAYQLIIYRLRFDSDYWSFYDAPEEVQRMFLLFCAEDCES